MSLPTPEFRIVPPPADGLAGAFRAAAQRRRRKAATTGGAGVLTAAVAFAVLTGSTGQVLTTEPAPPADQRPSLVELVPAGPQGAVATPPTRVAVPQPAAGAAGPLRAGVAPRLPAPGSAVGAARSQARAETRRTTPVAPYRTSPMTRSDDSLYLPALECPDTVGALDMCSDVRVAEVYETSAYVSYLEYALCNTGTTGRILRFGTRAELDLVVTDVQGDVLWRWSAHWPAVEDPHTLIIGASSCSYWTTKWPQVDGTGRPLPKGAYVLEGRLASDDAGEAGTDRSDHSVS